jgi:RNA polymerase sigma-70 factor (ECF subfamily)
MKGARVLVGVVTPEEFPLVYDSFVLDKRDHYFSYAAAFLGSPEDARDVVNDVFFKIYLRWDDVLASASSGAYGWKILRDALIDALRHRDRRPSQPAGLHLDFLPAESDAGMEQAELRPRINQALQKLPERQRTCVFLHYLLDKSVKEVAALTGVRPSTVRSHLAAARPTLQALLADLSDTPPTEKGCEE